jgi:hypothetical protein
LIDTKGLRGVYWMRLGRSYLAPIPTTNFFYNYTNYKIKKSKFTKLAESRKAIVANKRLNEKLYLVLPYFRVNTANDKNDYDCYIIFKIEFCYLVKHRAV